MMKNSSQKICFVLLEAYPYFNPNSGQTSGGAELQLFLLSTNLAKNEKYNISFIVGNYNQQKIEKINNVKIIKSFNAKRNDSFFAKFIQSIKFLRILKKEKPDIIFSTTNNTLVVLCSLYCLFSKTKHIHRIAHDKDTGYDRKTEFGLLARLYTWGMKKAHVVLVQNQEQKKNLFENFTKKAILLTNAFPVKESEEMLKSYFLWVSRYQKWKHPELFIQLAEKITDANFVMICPPSQKNIDNWRALKKKSDELSNMQFIEFVPFVEIESYFDNALAFVNTSETEGFPNTFLQAAQAKVPIISLNVNPNSFITKYDCGVFCNNNFNYLVEQVSILVNNQNRLKEKGENCYRYLKENHDIKTVINQLEEIINSLQ